MESGKPRMPRDELEDFFNATLYGETGSFSAFIRRTDVDFSQSDEHGNSALHFAVQGNQPNFVEQLLTVGADIEAKTTVGSTPFIKAARLGRQDLMKLLLTKGANINAQEGEGNTALHNAASRNDIPTIQYLLEKKADTTIKNNAGQTAADLAKDYPEASKLLA
eukprot:TRINITY_DN124_c0_g1_i1.p1 TRINITY_DN124_c0_g1~~TRINITY_DN124_c0_g1_i1.p1  ORF type:complete len:164 (-),score=48.90 TRINITY_DN124_c0_g1_i1:12-503(-)